jgi:hypothetical protein
MRPCRSVLPAVAALLLLLSVAACTSTSARCRNNSCVVAVKSTSPVSTEILGHRVTFEDLVAGSVTVVYAQVAYPIEVGHPVIVGPMTVTVVVAEPGRARLSIVAERRGDGTASGGTDDGQR